MIGALEVGVIYGVMALGVFLTFRVLNFPDLTVDGSFTTGGATAAIALLAGWPPVLATLLGFAAGAVAGFVTGILHTKGRIDGLLAGILTMIALWSINLRIMGSSNKSLLGESTLFTPLSDAGLKGTWGGVAVLAVAVLVLGAAVVWFLHTNLGLSLRATGDNAPMITSFGVSTDFTKTFTLTLSNGFVGMCGALIAQYQGYADISMGIGLILVGLASVIMGQALLGQKKLWIAVLAVIVGAVIYRLIIFLALIVGLDPNDMKLVTAVLVVIALLVPRARAVLGPFGRRAPARSASAPATAGAPVPAETASASAAGASASAADSSSTPPEKVV